MQTFSIPTSSILRALLKEAPSDVVTLGWIMGRLDERSFGLIILLCALLALVPGASLIAGVLVTWIAAQMMLGQPRPTLPRLVARRTVSTPRLARLIARTVPVLRWLERFIRPRWITPFAMTRRVVGAMLLLLGLSLLIPVPFSQFLPAFAILGVALAYLERDGITLALALVVATASLGASAAAVWGAVYGIQVLNS